LRTTAVPTESGCDLVDIGTCTQPFPGLVTPHMHLAPVLGVNFRSQLYSAMNKLRSDGVTPLALRVPIAVSDRPSTSPARMLPVMFIPDGIGYSSGWLITMERWDGRLARPFLLGAAFAAALSLRPDLSLAEYNRAPSCATAFLHRVVMRTSGCPTTPNATVDAQLCTLPFDFPQDLSHLEPVTGVLGHVIVQKQLASAMSALRASDIVPIAVRVPIRAIEGSASASFASTLRPMLYIPDVGDSSSGWLIAPERWYGKRAEKHFLSGNAFRSALSLCLDLSLDAYNRAPTLTAAQLPRVMLRTTEQPTASGSLVNALACTLPFFSTQRLFHLEPVLGTSDIEPQLAAALSALHSSGGLLIPVRVPIAVNNDRFSIGAPVQCLMMYVPDSPDSGSGWLIPTHKG
jgi:hypothetical protein